MIEARRRERPWQALAAAAAAIFAALALHAAWVETPTVDEFAHLPAGVAYLDHGAFGLYAKNPPLFKMLMAAPVVLAGVKAPEPPKALTGGWAPWIYGSRFLSANRGRYFYLFFLARVVVVVAALLTGLVLYRWARELFGVPAAAVSTALFLLDPTVLAHGHLATVDVATTFTMLLSVFVLRRALAVPSRSGFALAGLAWGGAVAVKFTALLLLPVLFALAALGRRPRQVVADMAIFCAVALLTINLPTGFAGSGRPLGSFSLPTGPARVLQQTLPGWLPVPLPATYVQGLSTQMLDVSEGEFPTYFAGSWRTRGPWYYDIAAFVAKTPLPALVVLVLGIGAICLRPLPGAERLAVLAPIGLTFVAASFSALKIGVRYLLPAIPLLYLAGAALVGRAPGRRVKFAMLAAVALQAGIALRTHPGYLSYFNVAAGGGAGGHRLLLDSNLDWGQDLYRLPEALRRLGNTGKIKLLYFGHVDPALYGIDYELAPPFPVEGLVAVSVNFLMGAQYAAVAPGGGMSWVGRDHLAWLRSRRPAIRCGSIWVFDTRRTPGAAGDRPPAGGDG